MSSNNIDVLIEESPIHIELFLKYFGYHEKLPRGHVYGDIVSISRDYIFQYCTRGKGEFVADGKTFCINKGDCMITFPGQIRIERADNNDPWGLMWIGINGKSAETFFEKLNVSPENPIIKNLEHTDIPDTLKNLIEIAESVGFEKEFLLSQKLFALLDKLTVLSSNYLKEPPHITDTYVTKATYYLETHYSDKNLSIGSLAANIGLNRSYLYKIFKEKTGLSPQQYLNKIRIKNAVDFMKIPNATITSVANSVGYEPSVFSKAFKKEKGVTPSEYINNSEI